MVLAIAVIALLIVDALGIYLLIENS